MESLAQTRLDKLHSLWQTLTFELTDIFDAHGICSVVAHEIALHTKTTTIVGVRDPQHPYFNVWICDPAGNIQQQRWNRKQAAFTPLIAQKAPAYTEKFDREATELIGSELWQYPRQAVLSVPLPYPAGDSPMTKTPPGILALIDPDDSCCLTLDNLAPLATNITTFLDRAFLRHHIDRQDVEFAIVSDINYALASKLSLRNIFHQLMGPVSHALNVETVSIGLIEPGSNDIVFVEMLLGPHFKNLPPIRLKQGQGIAGWVIETGQPLVINDVYVDDRFYSKVDHQSGFKTRSMVCIPLQVEERIIGILQAINKQDGNFSDNDLRLLQAIAGPLAAAIENANLHTDVIAEKRRIETIFANMSEGLLTVNAEGYITQANDSLMTILSGGQQPGDLYGTRAKNVIHLKKGSFANFIEKVLASEGESPQLAVELCPDKHLQDCVPVLISGSPILKEDGSVDESIFVFSDLRQIREVERMRDDFFHGIVHELRTPLATILMYARMLRSGKAKEQEKADRFLGVIERESDRLQKMVRQMLEVAKLEARELQRSQEPIALNPIFEDMLPSLADLAIEKGLLFRQRIEPDLPPVYGNAETLYLIFKNLVENAIKFTLAGSVRVDARQVNGSIQFEVTDEGIGIPKPALPNLFKRFYRTQNAVERGIAGTGLGLYMVKENVENYNGTIEVSSSENEGTTFTVRFPIVDI